MTTLAPDGTNFMLTGPNTAPVVVLIHGLGLNKDCWQWMIPDLTDSYRVLSYDLYGHGGSNDPVTEPSLSLFSKQLRDLLDYCKTQKAVIIGFSLGGMIARALSKTPHKSHREWLFFIRHTDEAKLHKRQFSNVSIKLALWDLNQRWRRLWSVGLQIPFVKPTQT